MKIKKSYIIGAVLGILIVGYLYGRSKENYGQDASIRMGAGGVAGTGMYGFDPIQEFASQIDRMSEEHKEGYCPYAENGRCGYFTSGTCPYAWRHHAVAYPTHNQGYGPGCGACK